MMDTLFTNKINYFADKYDFVHIDGPHTTLDVVNETIFFAPRIKK
jgi:hypothetical protein